MSPRRDRIFISYSRKDGAWLERLQTMLKPLRKKGIAVWEDTQIQAGAVWKAEVKEALAAAKVAVLLVSPNFLASDFIDKEELPPLLNAAQQEGLKIIWVCLSYCLYDLTEIADYQAAHDPSQPLSSLSLAEQDRVLLEIGKQIAAAVQGETAKPRNNPKPQQNQTVIPPSSPPSISVTPEVEVDDLSSEVGVDYSRLQELLAEGKWREADEETARKMLAVMGKESWSDVYIESIKRFPCTDLRTIDRLWIKYSKGRFGFSVQKRIWKSLGGKPGEYNYKILCQFGDRVGWRVKGNWKKYNELTFDIKAPEGHLPSLGEWSFEGFINKFGIKAPEMNLPSFIVNRDLFNIKHGGVGVQAVVRREDRGGFTSLLSHGCL